MNAETPIVGRVSRRDFLRFSGLALGGSILTIFGLGSGNNVGKQVFGSETPVPFVDSDMGESNFESPITTTPPTCDGSNQGMPLRISGELNICAEGEWRIAQTNLQPDWSFVDPNYGRLRVIGFPPEGLELKYREGLQARVAEADFDSERRKMMYRVEIFGPDGMGVYWAEATDRPQVPRE